MINEMKKNNDSDSSNANRVAGRILIFIAVRGRSINLSQKKEAEYYNSHQI
jgi:hypothetical protein